MNMRTWTTNSILLGISVEFILFPQANSNSLHCQVKEYKYVWQFCILLSAFYDTGKHLDALLNKTRFNIFIKLAVWDFPSGPVVKNLPSNAGDEGLSLAGELRSHMPRGN